MIEDCQYPANFIFDSSYPTGEIALPLDEGRRHIIVSPRSIEPPPGQILLQLEATPGIGAIWRNLRSLRNARGSDIGGHCFVIAPSGVRGEQLLINCIYALSISPRVFLFDGLKLRSIRDCSRLLIDAGVRTAAKAVLGRWKARITSALIIWKMRDLPERCTPEGKLYSIYTRQRSFSIPPDEVTPEAEGGSIYGNATQDWYLPALSSRRHRFSVRTTRHYLRNVTLHVEDTESGSMSFLFRAGQMLDYPYLLGRLQRRARYTVRSRRAVRSIEGGVNLLAYTTGYYHWLVEGIPRILDVIDDGIDFDRYPLILPPLAPFQKQMLEILGISTERQVISISGGDWCHVDECVFPTINFAPHMPGLEDPSGQPNRELLLRVRNRLLSRLPAPGPGISDLSDRIYVSRAKAARRRMAPDAEAAVAAKLQEAGFDTIYLEDLSWPLQIQRMAMAKVVVGLHGAGLSNLLFANATSFVEIHNPLEARPHFAFMARELKIDYAFVIGSLRGHSAYFDNIVVDPQAVRAALDRLDHRH